jgi:Rod binding domain-containing protein
MADPISPIPPAPPAVDPKARAAAKAFEAVFIGQMTKLMMETAPVEGDFSGGHGEEMFRGVLAEQLGTAIAQGRGIGIADKVLGEIIRLQQGGGQ